MKSVETYGPKYIPVFLTNHFNVCLDYNRQTSKLSPVSFLNFESLSPIAIPQKCHIMQTQIHLLAFRAWHSVYKETNNLGPTKFPSPPTHIHHLNIVQVTEG